MSVTAQSLQAGIWPASQGEVVQIKHQLGALEIEVSELGGNQRAHVRFVNVEAFRVMDERDLSEYWPVCSSQNGLIFEIFTGGWLSQELERPGSLVAKIYPELKEFLVTGVDDCVSVLTMEQPEVHIL